MKLTHETRDARDTGATKQPSKEQSMKEPKNSTGLSHSARSQFSRAPSPDKMPPRTASRQPLLVALVVVLVCCGARSDGILRGTAAAAEAAAAGEAAPRRSPYANLLKQSTLDGAAYPAWAHHHWVWLVSFDANQTSELDLVNGYLIRNIPVRISIARVLSLSLS